MTSSRDLPDELLLHIVNSGITGKWWEDTCWFQSLARVNHQFYDIASPLSFKEFSYRGLERSRGRNYDGLWGAGKWAKLILEDDSKSALVQSVDIEFPYSAKFGLDSEGQPNIITSLTAPRAPRALKTIDCAFEDDESRRKEWLEHCFEKHTPEYILALTIVQLPNLRRLDLQNSDERIWDALSILINALAKNAQAAGAEMPLKAIETVVVGCEGGNKYPDPTRPLAMAAIWPNVKTIMSSRTADGDNEHDPDKIPDFMNLEPNSTDLRHIKMRPECKLLSEHLHKLVGSAKALEKFDYHVGHAWGWIGVKTAEIARALSQQGNSLKEVVLHHMYHEKDMSDDLEYHDWQPMSFDNFKVLEDIQISVLMLFGLMRELQLSTTRQHALKALPASVKFFSIVQCEDENDVRTAMDAFGAVARAKKDKFPELRELHIGVVRGSALDCAKDLARAEQWSAANDVRLVLWECEESLNRLGLAFTAVQLDEEKSDDQDEKNDS